MSNKHTLFPLLPKILRSLAIVALSIGISLTAATDMHAISAGLSGQGSTLHSAAPLPVEKMIPVTTASFSAADEMVIGILLILLGFFLHALARSRSERNIRITSVPRKEKTMTQNFIWMEMKM